MAVSKLGYKAFSLYEGQAIKRQPGVGVWASISICLSFCSVFNG